MALSQHCEPLAHPYWLTTLLAASLVLGILVSYIPQHLKIVQRKTSEGLSPWWVLLGGLSSVAAIGNILTLPTSRADMHCCKELSSGACAAALLGVAQIGVQWTCFMIIVMLYLLFFPPFIPRDSGHSPSAASITPSSSPQSRRDPILVGSAIFSSVFVVGLTSIILVIRYPHHTQTWADILGTIAGVLAAIQYFPQIYYTWVMGDMKSLSVITLVIQAPGAFVFALSLALRVGVAGWSTWMVYIVTGLLQFVLLFMAIAYWNKERHHQRFLDAAEHDAAEHRLPNGTAAPNERTSLLPAGRTSEIAT